MNHSKHNISYIDNNSTTNLCNSYEKYICLPMHAVVYLYTVLLSVIFTALSNLLMQASEEKY